MQRCICSFNHSIAEMKGLERNDRYSGSAFPDCRRRKWSSGLRTLIVVHSRPSQGDFRTAVRETWGGREAFEAVGVRPLFFLGRSTDPEGDLYEI